MNRRFITKLIKAGVPNKNGDVFPEDVFMKVRRLHFSNVIGIEKNGEVITDGSSKSSNLLRTVNFRLPDGCPWIRFGFWVHSCEVLTDSLIELGRVRIWLSLRAAFRRWIKTRTNNVN